MSGNKSIRGSVYGYIKKKYGADPEFLWMRFPDDAVFRHEDNRKWFGIIMALPRYKLGISGTESVDILNLKIDDLLLADMLISRDGFFRAYHMSHRNWITVLLDGTVPKKEIFDLIDLSFRATSSVMFASVSVTASSASLYSFGKSSEPVSFSAIMFGRSSGF